MVDVQKPEVLEAVTRFHLGNRNMVQPEFTFDGLQRQILNQQFSFVQVHRDGLLIAKIQLPLREEGGVNQLRPSAIDIFLRSFVEHSIQVYSSVPINGPFLLSMVLRTVGNTRSRDAAMLGAPWEENGGQINAGIYPFPVMEATILSRLTK